MTSLWMYIWIDLWHLNSPERHLLLTLLRSWRKERICSVDWLWRKIPESLTKLRSCFPIVSCKWLLIGLRKQSPATLLINFMIGFVQNLVTLHTSLVSLTFIQIFITNNPQSLPLNFWLKNWLTWTDKMILMRWLKLRMRGRVDDIPLPKRLFGHNLSFLLHHTFRIIQLLNRGHIIPNIQFFLHTIELKLVQSLIKGQPLKNSFVDQILPKMNIFLIDMISVLLNQIQQSNYHIRLRSPQLSSACISHQIRLVLWQIWMDPHLHPSLLVNKHHLLYYIEISHSFI